MLVYQRVKQTVQTRWNAAPWADFMVFPRFSRRKHNDWLVVWNMNFMTFHSVGNFIIPTDEVIFFRGVGIPPTRWSRSKRSTLAMCIECAHFPWSLRHQQPQMDLRVGSWTPIIYKTMFLFFLSLYTYIRNYRYKCYYITIDIIYIYTY